MMCRWGTSRTDCARLATRDRRGSGPKINGGKMRITIKVMMASVLLLFVTVRPATPQVTTATFYGIVTDSSEAVLPGATVTMTEENTGAVNSKVTDEKGEFAFTFLAPGSYTLKIELPGFKTYNSVGFQLGAAQSVRRSFSLEVG